VLLSVIGGSMALQVSLLYVPAFRNLFHLQALSLKELGVAFAASLCIPALVEMEKWARRQGVIG